MTYFLVTRSIFGDYWQVRVRNSSGYEDTVDKAYTLVEARRIFDSLKSQGMKPLSERPS